MLQQPRHRIGAEEVHVWHLLEDGLADHAAIPDLYPLLSDEEHQRMSCLRRERDRTLFLLSRALMRTVLASYLQCSGHDVRFCSNDFGKPILHAEVCGSAGLHFNLTHSRGAVALAVSRGREVGVDVEERGRQVEHLALAERFFAPAEAKHLQDLCEEERGPAFFAIWTLKEAFVKGIGRGLSFPLDAFCFELELDRLVGFRPLADFVSPDWHFQQFDMGDRHCGAVAVQTPPGAKVQITLRDWREAFLA